MVTTLQDVSEAIVAAIEDVGGSGLDVTAYPTEGATPPFAQLEWVDWNVEAFGRQGTKSYAFDLRIIVPRTTRPQDAYWQLLELVDSTSDRSIEVAIWDADLSFSVFVESARMLGAEEIDGTEQLGAVMTIRVTKKGTD